MHADLLRHTNQHEAAAAYKHTLDQCGNITGRAYQQRRLDEMRDPIKGCNGVVSMSWKLFEDEQPELATFGAERLNGKVAYLATVRKDGSPRVHPVTPIIGQGHLFVFMEPTSPKGHDLRRDGRYAIHCAMSDTSGASGEFTISGHAQFIDDPERRETAVQLASYTPSDRYILFEFRVERVASTIYEGERVIRQRWKQGSHQ